MPKVTILVAALLLSCVFESPLDAQRWRRFRRARSRPAPVRQWTYPAVDLKGATVDVNQRRVVVKPKSGGPITLGKPDNPVDVTNLDYTIAIEPAAQEFAKREAELLAKRGYRVDSDGKRHYSDHVLGIAPGATVAGVGAWIVPQCPTCRAPKGYVLVADAKAYSPKTKMWYRSRHWKSKKGGDADE